MWSLSPVRSKRIFAHVIFFGLLITSINAQTVNALQYKSPGRAVLFSAAGTLCPSALSLPFLLQDTPESDWNEIVGIGLMSTGLLFGPGMGHRYASNTRAFYRGVIIRGIGGCLFLAGISAQESIFDDDTVAGILIISGGVIVLTSTIADIVTADNSARRVNEHKGSASVTVTPVFLAETGSVMTIVSIRF